MPPRRRRSALKPTVDRATAISFARKASAEDPRVMRARLAVERFRRMVPGLTGFAKMITRNENVRVQISASSPYTDGKTIFMRPPIELGDDIDHLRTMCDQRDSYGPLCPACRRMEEIMTGLFHEIAHIAFDSFAKVSESDKRDLLERALREAGDPADHTTRAGKIKQRIETGVSKLESADADSYVSVSQLVSPYLPMLINGMEDWRVNTSLGTARPGTRGAFASRYRKFMEQGITEMDGTVWFWRDRPDNSQVIIGVLLKLCGYEFYRDNLAPHVVAALDSPEMEHALRSSWTIRSARGVYEMAFPVLEAARAHGFLKADDDPEDDAPEPPMGEPEDGPSAGEPESSDETSDEEAGKGASSDDDEGESSEGDSDSDGDETGGEGDTDEPADEDSTGSSTGDDDEDADGDNEAGGSSPDRGDDGRDTDEDEDSDGGAAGESDDEGDEGESSTDIDAEIKGDDDGGEDEDETDPDNAAGTGESGDEASDKDSERSEDLDGDDDDDDDEGGTEEDGEAGDSGDASDHAPKGEPSDAASDLERFLGHDNPGWFPTDSMPPESSDDDEDSEPEDIDPESDTREIDRAIVQGEFFDRPASGLFGVQVYTDPEAVTSSPYNAWGHGEWAVRGMTEAGENILGPSLMRMRLAFADNAKRKKERNLKAGRVNTRTLGRRAATGDERLFYRPNHPGKKDYFVVIGMDISGSTSGRRVQMIKSAALAQAELLHRTGVKFAVYAHTGGPGEAGYDLHIYQIKGPDEPWSTKQKEKLRSIYASAANLDGHTMEYYRKVCDKQRATDKVIMYYTDGAMPAENYNEELEVLNDEIKIINRKGYVLVAVGVENSEPEGYGIETVRLDSIEDVPNVVKFLEKRLDS